MLSHMEAGDRYSVYKALADPSRRQLLDLLREGPRTTGTLCEHFEMTRFGVMKHLDVLVRAGLVLVRRRGRQRFNHLNAVPIQQIYERWVGPFASLAATSLTNLKQLAQRQEKDLNMTLKTEPKSSDLSSFHIAQEVVIAAPRERVWKALTEDIDSWWAYRLGGEGQGKLSVEARIGGQFLEDCGQGEGSLWGTVTQFRVNELLRLNGALGMYNRPVNSLYTYELEDCDGGTLLKLTHECYGLLEKEWEQAHTKGWQELLGCYLKAYAEQGKTWKDTKADKAEAKS